MSLVSSFNSRVAMSAILSVVLLVGCVSKSEVKDGLDDNDGSGDGMTGLEIELSGSVEETRGVAYDSFLPSLDYLSIWCYNMTDNEDFFNSSPEKYKIKDGGQTLSIQGTSVYYWPEEGTELSFRACYPNISTEAEANDDEFYYYEQSDGGLVIHQPEATSKQVDFMAADVTTVSSGEVRSVALTFKHQMAKVKFAAAYKLPEDETILPEVKVTKITLELINRSAKFYEGEFTWLSSGDKSYTSYTSIIDGSLIDTPIGESSSIYDQDYADKFTTISDTADGVMFITPQTLGDVVVDYTVEEIEYSDTFNMSAITLSANSSIVLYMIIGSDVSYYGDWEPDPINP